MKTNDEFSKDLPTLRRELTDVLPKSGVLKRTLDMETIVDDGVTVLIWLGVLIGIAFMIFEGYLFFGLSGITSTGLAAYFQMLFLVVTVAVLRPIPLVWEGAVLVKIGLSFYRAIIRQRLLADFQRDPETLQVGVAYAINAENDVIIQPSESKHSFQQAINTLTKEQHHGKK